MLTSELVGRRGIYNLLETFFTEGETVDGANLAALLENMGVSQEGVAELSGAGLISSSAQGFYLSGFGQTVTLLLRGINEKASLGDVVSSLTRMYPDLRPYTLITHDITNVFIDSLLARPDFIRIYICSPWIRLDEEHFGKIRRAIERRKYERVELFVITLPPRRYRDPHGIATLRGLVELGAEVVTNGKLHTKLYISEPGPRGGAQYAIFGSENLTGKRNIELGVKIENDNELLAKLTEYFRTIQFDELSMALEEKEL